MDFAFLIDTMQKLLAGVPLTLELTFVSVAIGAALAVLLAVLRASFLPCEWLVRAYVFVLRGTPLLLQIFLIYYGIGQFAEVRNSFLWPFLRQPYWCAILALSLNTAAYGAEIIRGGLLAVPQGAAEAARVSGMSGFLLYRRIILPLAIRQALPAYGNELVIMVKSTSLASIVTLMEVSGISYAIISETYRALEVFLCAGSIYLVINFLLTRAIAQAEAWLNPHLRPATS
ncbi:ABC transporter permease [Limobrevibacterium gyesilva]|uniref:ABC transporter permease n=1 Tax=Limobrevibacterium gyesilva TaxID=2991712 RepID=A0AA41YLV7_9PROT|nr:ABC transporter permease [Limobrevibacterium gyesilva]MCW3474343.1 ABC transporter permease [Limobrevibacterium gyesilva]